MQLLDLEENPLGSFTSLREAADAVDTNHMLLSRYAKSTDTVFLDFLVIKVDIYCQGFTKEGHVIHPASKVYAPLVHDIILPEDVICVLDSSITRVLATYSSMYVASQTLGIDRKKFGDISGPNIFLMLHGVLCTLMQLRLRYVKSLLELLTPLSLFLRIILSRW